MQPGDPPRPLRPPDYEPATARASLLRRPRRRLALLPLVMVMFFSVSGGAYGLEGAIGVSGAGMALLLLLVVPLLWSAPCAYVVGELQAAMPAEGGYYAWVKQALGPFWGFQEGWWSWTNSFVDMAIYPVLFADYLNALLDEHFGVRLIAQNGLVHWLVTLALIWTIALLNIRGIRPVGATTVVLGVVVLVPFAIMSVIGVNALAHHPHPILQPFLAHGQSLGGALGLGLFIVMWNYLGWDGPSTVSGEIERPAITYPRAILICLPLIAAAYVLPVIAGLSAVPASSAWTDGAFPDIARAVGGDWLGVLVAIGGLASAAGLYAALLLSNSRLPFVLAEDGYLPRVVSRVSHRYETPWLSIVICSAIYSVFTLSTFNSLIQLDVVVYSAALFLEFAALIQLRRRAPAMRRPLRVPGGRAGLAFCCVAPVAVVAIAIGGSVHDSGISALYLPAISLASGFVVYPLARLLFKRGAPDVPVPFASEPLPATP
jgi:amino acid transporter